mgnify:CR=1 FL=1
MAVPVVLLPVATDQFDASFGFSHLRATNSASNSAPAENTRSPGMRIHTSMSMIGRFMNSAERANQ